MDIGHRPVFSFSFAMRGGGMVCLSVSDHPHLVTAPVALNCVFQRRFDDDDAFRPRELEHHVRVVRDPHELRYLGSSQQRVIHHGEVHDVKYTP